jgi:hypothetical protein
MAGKKFTLAVVFLLGALAAGQESTQGTGTAGVATFTWNSSAGAGQFSSYASAGEAPTQSSSLPDTIAGGGAAAQSDGGGSSWDQTHSINVAGNSAGAMAAGAQYGYFLGMGVFNSAQNLVATTLKAGAVIGATAVGDVPAGIGVLISLFPQYAPGANCPGCAIAMVTPMGKEPPVSFSGKELIRMGRTMYRIEAGEAFNKAAIEKAVTQYNPLSVIGNPSLIESKTLRLGYMLSLYEEHFETAGRIWRQGLPVSGGSTSALEYQHAQDVMRYLEPQLNQLMWNWK